MDSLQEWKMQNCIPPYWRLLGMILAKILTFGDFSGLLACEKFGRLLEPLWRKCQETTDTDRMTDKIRDLEWDWLGPLYDQPSKSAGSKIKETTKQFPRFLMTDQPNIS